MTVVRAAANTVVENHFRTWHLRHSNPILENTNRRANSSYFLRGITRDVHYDRPFYGCTSGRNGDYRSYFVSAASGIAELKEPLASRIKAEPLETGILSAVRILFADTQLVDDCVRHYIASISAKRPSRLRAKELKDESETLKRRLTTILETFNPEEMAESREYISGLRSRRAAIEHELTLVHMDTKASPEVLISSITKDLMTLDRKLNGECFEKLRLLLKIICPRILVNLATFDVEVDVALPKSLIHKGSEWSVMSGTYGGQVSTRCSAHRDLWLPIGCFRLKPVFGEPFRHRGRLHKQLAEYSAEPRMPDDAGQTAA